MLPHGRRELDPNISFAGDWTAPGELTGMVPRKARLWNNGIATTLVAIVFLAAAVGFTIWAGTKAAQQMAQTAALRREGQETLGEVKRLWRSGRSMTPRVSYTFTTQGAVFTGESRVPEPLWRGLWEAGHLSIRFLPSSPAINHPVAWEESALSAWAMLVFAVVPAALGILFLTQLRRQRHLATEGLPAAGVVTKCSRGSKGGWWVEYQFRTEDGKIAKGGGWPEDRLPVGANTCVLYLPQNPRLNQPYPMSYYRVVQ